MSDATGICLQMGLFRTAEYLYLTGTEKSEIDDLKGIPDFLEYTNWKYYGIDCDPCSIAYMLQKYHTNKFAEWVLASINQGVSPSMKYVPTWYIGDADEAYYYVPTISFDTLIDSLGLEKIDILAVDIEGVELGMFKNYSWRLKPAYIAVESHNEQHIEILDVIEKQGYKNTLNVETNFYDGCYHTRELQFVRDIDD